MKKECRNCLRLNMSWELFYLICFAVGFLFSVLSFLSGTLHLHIHVPKHFHVGGIGHAPGHGPVGGHGSPGHAPAQGAAAKGHAKSGRSTHFSFINPMTLAAFLTWFGGTGYLLERL